MNPKSTKMILTGMTLLAVLLAGVGFATAQDANETNETYDTTETSGMDEGDGALADSAGAPPRAGHSCPDKAAARESVAEEGASAA